MMKQIAWLFVASLYHASSQDMTCLTKKAADPSFSANVPCTFPFTYGGKTHTGCTSESHPEEKSWCSTKVDSQGAHVEGGGHWGLCGKGCPHEKGCPLGWQRLNTGCYRFEDSDQGVGMDEAQTICEEFGGYLVEINSKEEGEVLKAYYEDNLEDKCLYKADGFWIGIMNDTTMGENGAWVTAKTGEDLSYTNWYDTEPNHVNDNEQCAVIFANSNQASDFAVENFKWIDLDCKSRILPFYKQYDIKMKALCEKYVDSSLAVTNVSTEKVQQIVDNGCLDGWTKLATGCYLFKRQPSTFQQARDICDKAGGYIVEIDTEEEYSALEREWKVVNDRNVCENNGVSWWIGVTDAQEEGTWKLDYSGTPLKYSAWYEPQEPNNYGGKVPGEDCVVANLGFKNIFQWFDVDCTLHGIPVGQGKGISFNPLCEQYSAGQKKRREGIEEKWLEVGKEKYKFIKTVDGTTREEAENICNENGGYLTEIKSEEERKALKKYYEENVKQKTSWFMAALSLIRENEEHVKFGWWIGATDETEEGMWRWRHSGENMTYSAWFQVNDNPRNENLFSYGGADCAAVVLKEDFIDVEFKDDKDEGENDDKWKEELDKDGDFKWIDLSCYTRVIPHFNVRMSPLCKL